MSSPKDDLHPERPAATAGAAEPKSRASRLEQEAEQLLQEMKVTKGSRFNAAERLRRRDRKNTYATAYLTGAVIVITMLPLIWHMSSGISDAIAAATIIFSLFILLFSLLQYSSGDAVRAEMHHRCATEINGLRRELRGALADGTFSIKEVGNRYDEILQRYSVNHEPIDFERYKLEHPHEYPEESPSARSVMKSDVAREDRLPYLVMLGATVSLGAIFVGAGLLKDTLIMTFATVYWLLHTNFHMTW